VFEPQLLFTQQDNLVALVKILPFVLIFAYNVDSDFSLVIGYHLGPIQLRVENVFERFTQHTLGSLTSLFVCKKYEQTLFQVATSNNIGFSRS
jgi:hypothetical protein